MPKVALLTSFHGTETVIGHAIRNWVLLLGLGNVSIFCKTKYSLLYRTHPSHYWFHDPVILFPIQDKSGKCLTEEKEILSR